MIVVILVKILQTTELIDFCISGKLNIGPGLDLGHFIFKFKSLRLFK